METDTSKGIWHEVLTVTGEAQSAPITIHYAMARVSDGKLYSYGYEEHGPHPTFAEARKLLQQHIEALGLRVVSK